MGMAIKVWGPSIAMLKGKTVRMMPPVVRQDVIEIPKEIWELHKDVTLTIDIFFVNKIPFFTTYSHCQIHEEDQPRNGMVARTKGAILLGPSGNAQGGHKFFTLTTGKVVICWAWTESPTSAAVIERVHLLAKGVPALPIFTDPAGCVIGDVEDVYLHNIEDEDVEALVDNSNLPGVHTAEADDEIPGVDMVQEQDVDVDLNFAPADEGNAKPPLVDIPPPVNMHQW